MKTTNMFNKKLTKTPTKKQTSIPTNKITNIFNINPHNNLINIQT